MTDLVKAQSEAQSLRLTQAQAALQEGVGDSTRTLDEGVARYADAMDAWDRHDTELVDHVEHAASTLVARVHSDLDSVSARTSTLRATASHAHAHTSAALAEQAAGLAAHMGVLDDAVACARATSARHTAAASAVFATIQTSRDTTALQVRTASDRLARADLATSPPRAAPVSSPLASLRALVAVPAIAEYEPTGATPPRATYRIPAVALDADESDLDEPPRPSLCELDPNLGPGGLVVEAEGKARRRGGGRENAVEMGEERRRKSARLL